MPTNVIMFSSKSFEKLAFEKKLLSHSDIKINFIETALTDKTLMLCQGFEVVCLFVSDKLDAKAIQQLHSMGVKLMALRSAGFNHIDVLMAKQLGIKVVRVPAYSPEAVAEFAVGIYITLNRKIHKAHQRVHEGNFSLHGLVGRNINSQTIGIVGTGNIGKCVAQIYRGFGAKVLAYDLSPSESWAKENKIEYTDLNRILKESDVVSLHIPLNSATKHIMNAERFSLMKKDSYFVNTSRGGLVEIKALIAVLKARNLAGAALDVYEEEEGIFFQDHSEEIIDDDVLARLTTFPNVLITSHQAFLTEEALNQIASITLKNISDWKSGVKLENEINI